MKLYYDKPETLSAAIPGERRGIVNREILFRGKRIDTGEWAEGFYCGGNERKTLRPCIFVYIPDRQSYDCQDIIPETLGQYTGLYDKNGVRIFENDIVRYTDLAFNPNIGRFENMIFTSAVTYNLDNGCFSPFEPDTFESYIRAENVEVIGNRFDNPDLLN